MVVKLQQEICERFKSVGGFDRASFNKPQSYSLYMRIGPRIFDGEGYPKALTLAAVSVEPEARRQGVFTRMVDEIEHAARTLTCDAVFVENVQNVIVQYALVRRSYRATRNGPTLNMLLEVGQ